MTFATCGGQPLEKVTLHVPFQGPWFADVSWLDDAKDVPASGPVTLTIGTVNFVGTLDPNQTGVFGLKKTGRLVAGANGWSKLIDARPGYVNDIGVKASTVASDAARACGETIGSFAGGTPTLGHHYARESGSAGRTLEDVARGATWWVDYAGITHVGTRSSAPAQGEYTLLSYDPRSNTAVLAVDAVDAVLVGQSVFDAERLPTPVTIRSMEVVVTPGAFRIRAWCGTNGETYLTQVMRTIVGRLTDQKLNGIYRYRAVRMSGNRVDLQAVKRSASLTQMPNQVSVDMTPGVSGAHATLTPGCLCYVQFVDGNHDDPIITSFAGRGDPSAVPQVLELGGEHGSEAATKGNTVDVLFPPMIFTGSIGGSPATGVVTAMTGKTLGTISNGSSKVKISNG